MREKGQIYAILKVERYIKNGSLVMTQDIVKKYSEIKQLNSKSNIITKEIYENL